MPPDYARLQYNLTDDEFERFVIDWVASKRSRGAFTLPTQLFAVAVCVALAFGAGFVANKVARSFRSAPPAPVVEDFAYDFENDPIGAAFYKTVPAFLDNVIARYEERREYSTDDFPLPLDDHAVFRRKVTNALVGTMSGSDWVVRNPTKANAVSDKIKVQEIGTVTVEDQTLFLSAITVLPTGDVIPMAMCFPSSKAPGVILYSGHTHFGLRELFVDKTSYQKAMALRLCQAGFATAAIEKIDSGIVSETFQHYGEHWRSDRWADDELEAATTLLGIGDYSIPGRQLMANIAALEIFASDPRVDETRIGAAGISLGGWLTLHTSLVSDRVKAVANYGGMWAYIDPFTNKEDLAKFEGINDYSQLIPGIWRLGDQNRFVLAASPIPMLTGYGEKEAEYIAYRKYFHPVIANQYKALGASDDLEIFIHEGGHEFPPDAVIDFFKRRL